MVDEPATPDPEDSERTEPVDETADDGTEEDTTQPEPDAVAAEVESVEVENTIADEIEQGSGAEVESVDADLAEGELAEGELAEGEIADDAEEAKDTEDENKEWYVVKVQSGREDTIRNAIERRVKIDGLEKFFGRIIVPVEKVTEMRNNKRVVREKKLYPGYLMVNVEYNDKILYLFRETSGVGDFVGGSYNAPPQPMDTKEVEYLLNKHDIGKDQEVSKDKPTPSRYTKGDKVRVKDGTFVGMEGEVMDVMESKGAVKVELSIFDRPVPVELEYWQVDFAE